MFSLAMSVYDRQKYKYLKEDKIGKLFLFKIEK